ncbi:MAG: hypothetical protein U0W40_02445 [Acidimicrobiia bacterium]
MAEISAKDVAALRKATGAGMMDCKAALEEAEGETERAMDLPCAAASARRASSPSVRPPRGHRRRRRRGKVAIVELNCNTDCRHGDEFVALLADHQLVAEQGDADVAAPSYNGSTVGRPSSSPARSARTWCSAAQRLRVRRRPSTATATSRTVAAPSRPRRALGCQPD